MCGVAGFAGVGPLWADNAGSEILKHMTDQIAARGPDADGQWIASDAPIALGHRRLSIVDITDTGAQPMSSHCDRYIISYNGEIYNAPELRAQLGAGKWRGTSDTEVLLTLISRDGLTATLPRLDGMFAFALFDKHTQTLTLARDKFGEKPLYYGRHLGHVIFASQLHAFRVLPDFKPDLNPDAIAAYFEQSNVPAPMSIWRGISKLPAGSLIEFNIHDVSTAEPATYWSASDAALKARANPFSGSEVDARQAVEATLTTSVKRRLMSDVPLGSLLSGGIDSSLTTALMQQISAVPIKTFTIGMAQAGFDESQHARFVSEHLGTDHSDLILTPDQVLDAIPAMAEIYDEPFSDSSQIPTYLVSKLARRNVTVALSGDGADELFAGYNRHFHGANIWAKLKKAPRPLRALAGAAIGNSPTYLLDQLGKFGPADLRTGRTAEKLKKLARLMQSRDQSEYYRTLLSTAANPLTILANSQPARPMSSLERALSFAEQMMLHDTQDYLPNDILTKTDRAAMAVSLELRTPYLNSDLFDLAWSLPHHMKSDGKQGKTVLRNILYSKIPRELVDRPKAGFAVPIGRWLRTDLNSWASDIFSSANLVRRGIYDIEHVQKLWREHTSGRSDHEAILWSILMFEGWIETTHLAGR